MPTELLNPTTVEVTDSVGIHHGPVGAREKAHDGAQEHVPPLQDVRGVVMAKIVMVMAVATIVVLKV